MSTTTDLSTLKINYLTQAQYDEAKRQGIVNENELYLTPATGSGVTDVEVDGVSVVSGGIAEITMPTVPTKVSDLTNDSGFITGYTETDPTVPSWAKASSKPSYTASEVGAVPTSRTVNGKALSSNITLSASDVSALPSSTVIPTITDTYSGTSSNGMSGKAVKSAIDALDGSVTGTAGSSKTLTAFSQTDGKVSATFGSISITKSQVSDFPTIPSTAADVGAVPTSRKVNGKALSSDITLSASDVSALPSSTSIPSKTSDLTNDSGFITGYTETDPVFAASAAHGITSSDISTWNGKSTVSVTRHTTSGTNIADLTINGTTTKLYAPQGGGGTLTDVTVDGTSVVSGSVAEIDLTGKADVSDIPTKVSDLTNDSGFITGYTETDPVFSASAASGITSSNISTWNGKYTKPSGGIPKTDLASAVQTSLGLADTALQSFTETDPTVPSWAKQASKPTYTASEVGALPSTTVIPSKTSDLTNDSGFITGVTSASTPTADTIAEFDGDAHMNSTDMTSQEVSDFVDGLDTQGSNIADYVVEQGTSGIWTYRKWNSGIAECWGTFTTSVTASNFNQWGQVYSMNIAKQALPSGLFLSGSYPICTASGAMDYGDAWVSCSGNSTHEYTTPFLYERGSAPNASLSKAVTSVSVIGRWK